MTEYGIDEELNKLDKETKGFLFSRETEDKMFRLSWAKRIALLQVKGKLNE